MHTASFRPTLAALTLAVSAFAFSAAAAADPLRYNQVQQKASHNSYERDESLPDQILYHRIRSLEIDIHNSNVAMGWANLSGDWYVYHEALAGSTDSRCRKLSDCLSQLMAVQRAVPDHEIITVFVEVKDALLAEDHHDGVDFDALVRRHIPEGHIFRPHDLMSACPGARTLQDAVRGRCAWPTLDSLRGKLAFVLFAKSMDHYEQHTPPSRVAFVARNVETGADIHKHPDTVFFNVDGNRPVVGPPIRAAGFVSRFMAAGSQQEFVAARHHEFHHLGTDEVNAEAGAPWSSTQNAQGYPFSCMSGGDCASNVEPGNILALSSVSGDIENKHDSFALLESHTARMDGTWSAWIAGPGSHVDEWSKGCLIARGSTLPGAPFFAVCREGGNHRMRASFRMHADAHVENVDAHDPPVDVAGSGVIFAKLVLDQGGKCARGESSEDGVSWRTIGERRCFAAPLAIQGLAASAHGHKEATFFFGNLTWQGQPQLRQAFKAPEKVGGATHASASDGAHAPAR